MFSVCSMLWRRLVKLSLTAGASLLGAHRASRMACLDTGSASIAPHSTWKLWFGREVRAFRSLGLRADYAVRSADREKLCCCSVYQPSGAPSVLPSQSTRHERGGRLGGNELSRSIVVEDLSLLESRDADAPSISVRAMPSLTGKMAPNAE
jgi:hypothetical protein